MPPAYKGKQKKRRLTAEEIEEYKEAFSLFDKDGSGKIDGPELGIVMKALGLNPSDAEISSMMNEIDTDGDGVIDFEEFCELMATCEDPEPNTIKKMFKQFDTNGDGGLTVEELRNGLRSLECGITDEEMDEMLRDADTDADGRISYDEFIHMMMQG